MEKIYQKLNDYLNDICVYLEKNDSFLLDKIRPISWLNDKVIKYFEEMKFFKQKILNSSSKENNLTFDDVFLLAREIIASIDKCYLVDFDNLIKSGELDFDFEKECNNSEFETKYKNGEIKKIINIGRNFNYDDVITLIHEYIHYVNSNDTIVGNYFSEFLSIYFEFYTKDYLLKKGIDIKEVNIYDRIKYTYYNLKSLYRYEIPLLAYINFGNLDSNTYLLLNKFVLNIKKEAFENECKLLCYKLTKIAESKKEEIAEDPENKGYYLSENFIVYDYLYILGTLLALYARKYCSFEKIVYLNNHINEFEGLSVNEICLNIGIDLNADDFVLKLFSAIDEYINKNHIENNRKI